MYYMSVELVLRLECDLLVIIFVLKTFVNILYALEKTIKFVAFSLLISNLCVPGQLQHVRSHA